MQVSLENEKSIGKPQFHSLNQIFIFSLPTDDCNGKNYLLLFSIPLSLFSHSLYPSFSPLYLSILSIYSFSVYIVSLSISLSLTHTYTHTRTYTYTHTHTLSLWCPCGVIVKAMDYGIVVSEFELQSHYYVRFRTNTLGKRMNTFIFPAMG